MCKAMQSDEAIERSEKQEKPNQTRSGTFVSFPSCLFLLAFLYSLPAKKVDLFVEYLKFIWKAEFGKKTDELRLRQEATHGRERKKERIQKKNSGAFNLNPEMKYRHLRFLLHFFGVRFFSCLFSCEFFNVCFVLLFFASGTDCQAVPNMGCFFAVVVAAAASRFVRVLPDFSVWFLFYTYISIIFSLL